MNLQSYLDEMGVPYRVSRHPSAYTAQDLAAAEHAFVKVWYRADWFGLANADNGLQVHTFNVGIGFMR